MKILVYTADLSALPLIWGRRTRGQPVSLNPLLINEIIGNMTSRKPISIMCNSQYSDSYCRTRIGFVNTQEK